MRESRTLKRAANLHLVAREQNFLPNEIEVQWVEFF